MFYIALIPSILIGAFATYYITWAIRKGEVFSWLRQILTRWAFFQKMLACAMCTRMWPSLAISFALLHLQHTLLDIELGTGLYVTVAFIQAFAQVALAGGWAALLQTALAAKQQNECRLSIGTIDAEALFDLVAEGRVQMDSVTDHSWDALVLGKVQIHFAVTREEYEAADCGECSL